MGRGTASAALLLYTMLAQAGGVSQAPSPPRDTSTGPKGSASVPARTFTAFSQDNGRVRDDMSFEVTGVFGAIRVNVLPVSPGWHIRSVQYDGRDLLDTSIEVSGGQTLDGVTVLLTRTVTIPVTDHPDFHGV